MGCCGPLTGNAGRLGWSEQANGTRGELDQYFELFDVLEPQALLEQLLF